MPGPLVRNQSQDPVQTLPQLEFVLPRQTRVIHQYRGLLFNQTLVVDTLGPRPVTRPFRLPPLQVTPVIPSFDDLVDFKGGLVLCTGSPRSYRYQLTGYAELLDCLHFSDWIIARDGYWGLYFVVEVVRQLWVSLQLRVLGKSRGVCRPLRHLRPLGVDSVLDTRKGGLELFVLV